MRNVTGRGLLGEDGEVGRVRSPAGLEQRVPHRQRDAVLEAGVCPDCVDEPVDPRDAVGVGAGDTGHPQHGPLDRHRGVRMCERDDRLAGAAREAAGAPDGRGIEVELARRAGGRAGGGHDAPPSAG
jgi:hypothetical protein